MGKYERLSCGLSKIIYFEGEWKQFFPEINVNFEINFNKKIKSQQQFPKIAFVVNGNEERNLIELQIWGKR